jgi:hypothetical protein
MTKSNVLLCTGTVITGLFLTACTSDHDRTAGRVLDDHRISSRVQSELNHSPVYKFPHVKVSAYNGAVQLNGFVNREEQKTEATELAKRVPGVTEVINNISMAPAGIGGVGARDSAGNTGRETNAPPGSPLRNQ